MPWILGAFTLPGCPLAAPRVRPWKIFPASLPRRREDGCYAALGCWMVPAARRRRRVRRTVEALGYVQVDTINAVERAHHHILMTRFEGYRPPWASRGPA